jgi:hypothetical protein
VPDTSINSILNNMRNLLLILLLCSKMSYAQFIKADLVASGLTCSMCNLATQKQLQTLNFVDSIVPDLETNTFYIYFNQQHEIDFGLIKKKVEDAGFFVAALTVLYKQSSAYRYNNSILFLENSVLFIDKYEENKAQQVFKFIDEGFLTAKEFKKFRKQKQELLLLSDAIALEIGTNKKIYYVVGQ